MKSRKQNISELNSAIAKTIESLSRTKAAVVSLESKLERQRAHLNTQIMLDKFDEIDELRQQFSDAIAQTKIVSDGHISELELQETQ